MTVIGRCVVVEMICSDLVMRMIYGAVVLGMINSAVVVDDCTRLVYVAVHGGGGRPLLKNGQ